MTEYTLYICNKSEEFDCANTIGDGCKHIKWHWHRDGCDIEWCDARKMKVKCIPVKEDFFDEGEFEI